VIVRGQQRPPRAKSPGRSPALPDQQSAILARAIGALDNLAEMAAGTGAHKGHTLEQVGMCVYCSCGGRFQGRIPKASAARDAAIEKSLARYFELTCGHYGTRELDELMRKWRTKRLQHYCETCNSWRLSKQNYTRGSEIPMEPMF